MPLPVEGWSDTLFQPPVKNLGINLGRLVEGARVSTLTNGLTVPAMPHLPLMPGTGSLLSVTSLSNSTEEIHDSRLLCYLRALITITRVSL